MNRTPNAECRLFRISALVCVFCIFAPLLLSCGSAGTPDETAVPVKDETTAVENPPEDRFRPAVSGKQKFLTYCPYTCIASNGESGGLLIYCREEGCIPYVLIERNPVSGFDPRQYLEEVYRPYLEQYYGKDLITVGSVATYEIGGRELPGCLYTYRVEDSMIEMLCVFLVSEGESVTFTAKYVQGSMEDVAPVFDAVIRYYRTTGELLESGPDGD